MHCSFWIALCVHFANLVWLPGSFPLAEGQRCKWGRMVLKAVFCFLTAKRIKSTLGRGEDGVWVTPNCSEALPPYFALVWLRRVYGILNFTFSLFCKLKNYCFGPCPPLTEVTSHFPVRWCSQGGTAPLSPLSDGGRDQIKDAPRTGTKFLAVICIS